MRTIAGVASRVITAISIVVEFAKTSVARHGDRRRTEADGLLRPQRSHIERQSGHQEKTDKINRIGLRRRDRPPQKSSDRRHRIAVVFHAAVLLDMQGNWKGQIRSSLTPPPASSAATTAPAAPTG